MKTKKLILILMVLTNFSLYSQIVEGTSLYVNSKYSVNIEAYDLMGESFANLKVYNKSTKKTIECNLVYRNEHGLSWYEGSENECYYELEIINDKQIKLTHSEITILLNKSTPNIKSVSGVYKNTEGDLIIISSYYENQFNFHVILNSGQCEGYDYLSTAKMLKDYSFRSSDGDNFKINGDSLVFEPGEQVSVSCNIGINDEFKKVKL